MTATVPTDASQLHSTGLRGVAQLGLPVEVRPEEVERKRTLGAAIELCAELSGYSLDKQLAADLKVDKGQFSRWTNGTEGIVWPKLQQLMDHCGNDAPVLWMLHARGYDLHAVRRRESELQRRLRLAEEENRLLRQVLVGRAA